MMRFYTVLFCLILTFCESVYAAADDNDFSSRRGNGPRFVENRRSLSCDEICDKGFSALVSSVIICSTVGMIYWAWSLENREWSMEQSIFIKASASLALIWVSWLTLTNLDFTSKIKPSSAAVRRLKYAAPAA